MNVKNIEDETSDYGIKLWIDPADSTAYYYTEADKVYLMKIVIDCFIVGMVKKQSAIYQILIFLVLTRQM